MDKYFGWCGRILALDLSSGDIQTIPTDKYCDKFVGGRGILSKIYWDYSDRGKDALHRDSPLILMTGPLAGTSAVAGSRWVIGGKSPLLYPDQFSYGNVGGSFAISLKSAGYDGIVITGKSKRPSYIHIKDDKIRFEDAGALWGRKTDDTLDALAKSHGVNSQALCIGPAGERKIRFSIIMSDRGACAGAGFGAVMGAKNLKAIVVEGSGKPLVAKPHELKETNAYIRSLIKGRELIGLETAGTELVKKTPCPACPAGCPRGILKHVSGREEYRKNCQSAFMYFLWDQKYNKGESTPNTFIATSLCNRNGLDTHEMGSILSFLYKCGERGILNDKDTGIPLSEIGSLEFIENLVDIIINRKGLGDLLAEGTIRAGKQIGDSCTGIIESFLTPNGRDANFYNPRFFLTNSVFYATETTSIINQLHEICMPMMKWVMWYATNGAMSPVSTEVMRKVAKKFWGSENAVDFSSFRGKADVARIIQDREYAKENLVVCDFLFPLTVAEGAGDMVRRPLPGKPPPFSGYGREFRRGEILSER